MNYPEYHYHWTWQLDHTPSELWPYVADTNRFNHDTGLSVVERVPQTEAESANAHRKLRFSRLGIVVEWTEEPFEWVEPRRFGVIRTYSCGPVARMRVLAEMRPSRGGTELSYQVWARPANLLGCIAIPIQIGIVAAKDFGRVFKRYDDLIDVEEEKKDQPTNRFEQGGLQRLGGLRNDLINAGGSEELTRRLVATIVEEPDIEIARMKPYVLADTWKASRADVLDLFLLATRVGILELSWDILCPLCRGPKDTASSLAGIEPTVHCETCNIDFDSDFERSVELIFRPSRTIRDVNTTDYCIAGPRVTPHVIAQQLMDPGESRTITPEMSPGRHRVRVLNLPGGRYFDVQEDGLQETTVGATKEGWGEDDLILKPEPAITVKNDTDETQLFMIEKLAWMDDAATAADVTVLQRYRDLFSTDALRPGQRISVGSLAILFTDLCDSTRMYREIGDAPAFGLVMDHFDILRNAISTEGGSIVKTIGDAVMAVFREPAPALRAILVAEQTLRSESGERQLHLKAGLHYGQCIAVNLNKQLDYFGTTVNLAARLEHLSEGGATIVSESVVKDPVVQDLLATDKTIQAESFQAELKGFDTPFQLSRIRQVG